MARSVPPRSSSDDGDAAHSDDPERAPRGPAREEPRPVVRDRAARRDALFRIQEEDEGERPVRFHLFQNGFGALTDGQVDALIEKIESYGGELTEEADNADAIVVQHVGVDELRKRYWWSRTVYVVEAAFVDICINSGKYKENLPRPERRGMGGQSVGAIRVPFTREDDEHLAHYLASVIPDEGEGGRGGIEIYRRLVELGQQREEFRWARRHPMWSWRERYSKRKGQFHPLIEHFVAANPPRPDGKGLYERSRYFTRGRGPGEAVEDEEDEEDERDAVLGEQEANQQRAPSIAQPAQLRRQRQSEPGPSRRADDNMQPPPRKRARHTTPQRQVSPVEQARGQRRAVESSPSASDEESWEAPSIEEDVEPAVDFDALFADNTNAEPPKSVERLPPSRLQKSSQAQPRKAGASSKPPSRNAQQRVPMSSQATLVAPSQGQHRIAPPSTLDGSTQVAREEEEESSDDDVPVKAPAAGPSRARQKPGPSRLNVTAQEEAWPQELEKRRVPAPKARRPVAASDRAGQKKRIGIVSMPPPPGLFPIANVLRNPSASWFEARDSAPVAGPSQPRQVSRSLPNEAAPSRRLSERSNAGPSESNAHTQDGDEDDKHVEELLALSHGTSMGVSAASKHPFEEADFDSDDERMAQNLLPSPAVNKANTSATHHLFGQQLPMHDADIDGDSPAPMRRAPGVQQLPSAQRPSAGRPSSKPLSAALVPPVALGRTVSTGSETDPYMPMPGTRARQEKTRMREQEKQTPYTPPSGTRAASSLQLRSRQVSRPALATSRR